MESYLLKWEINIEAETPQEAVKEALEIQRDPDSTALVFEVKDLRNLHNVLIDGEKL